MLSHQISKSKGCEADLEGASGCPFVVITIPQGGRASEKRWTVVTGNKVLNEGAPLISSSHTPPFFFCLLSVYFISRVISQDCLVG